MSNEEHHRDALIETARAELDRAHRGALAMEAGEVRRGLQTALAALQDAAGPTEAAPGAPDFGEAASKLAKALADLDAGSLAEMDKLIEEVRSDLA